MWSKAVGDIEDVPEVKERKRILDEGRIRGELRRVSTDYRAIGKWMDERLVPWILHDCKLYASGCRDASLANGERPFTLDINTQEIAWKEGWPKSDGCYGNVEQYARARAWNECVQFYRGHILKYYDRDEYGHCLKALNDCLVSATEKRRDDYGDGVYTLAGPTTTTTNKRCSCCPCEGRCCFCDCPGQVDREDKSCKSQ